MNPERTQTVCVFGATVVFALCDNDPWGATAGTQGGSVVRALLESGQYAIRAPTRNPNSTSAEALRKQGVEVVAADLNDEALTRSALTGSYAVFAVTNAW
ncbi:NmrA-like domain-containing protein 1 [Sticta canariensis]|nr:NmrA-like domain-containing protein 1 [Sticta canariensis]